MRYDDFGFLELGAFSATGSSSGEAVDVTGRVVGWSEADVNGVQVRLPFQYEEATGMVALPMANATEGWAEDVSIFGIEIVGTMRLANGRLQAWEYRPGSSVQVEPLSPPQRAGKAKLSQPRASSLAAWCAIQMGESLQRSGTFTATSRSFRPQVSAMRG